MKDFKNKVAVITGGASGIGRAIAERCVREKMKVVLADLEKDPLLETEKELKASGGDVIAVLTDVSNEGHVDALAQKTLNAFGGVHLLFNNAGVAGEFKSIWKNTVADWEWVLGVNLWGVIHGIRVFVPIMLQQDTPCHIINTSSISGVTSGPGLGAYKVSKHGVATLSETLYHELSRVNSKVKVSVLCPGMVNTQVADSERNRPAVSQENGSAGEPKTRETAGLKQMRQAIKKGMPPNDAADIIFDAIQEEKFFIFTHPELKGLIKMRTDDMLQDRNPTNPLES